MRTPIELALSVRSWERIVCLADPAAPHRHPEHWSMPQSIRHSNIDPETVVIVDRIEISPKVLGTIIGRRPRLIAFALASIDHERNTRRFLRECYPWSEAWDFSTDFAKILVPFDIWGEPYDRRRIIDMRSETTA